MISLDTTSDFPDPSLPVTPDLVSRQHSQFLVLMDKRASDLSRIADTAEEAGFPGVLKAVLTKEMAVAADVLEAFPLLKQTWGMGQVEAIQNLGMKLAKSKSMRCVSAAVAIVSAILQRCGQTISQGLTSKVQVDSAAKEEAAEACRRLEALVAVLSKYRDQFQDLMDVEYFLGKVRAQMMASPKTLVSQ